MQEQVKKYLDDKSVPYLKSQNTRDIRSGLIRVGTSFKLREDFYSATWIYLHKVDYILPKMTALDPDKAIENTTESLKSSQVSVDPYDLND